MIIALAYSRLHFKRQLIHERSSGGGWRGCRRFLKRPLTPVPLIPVFVDRIIAPPIAMLAMSCLTMRRQTDNDPFFSAIVRSVSQSIRSFVDFCANAK